MQSNIPLSQNSLWIIFTFVITVVIGPIFVNFIKIKIEKSGSIKITGNQILNIDGKTGHPKNNIKNVDFFSNLVMNRLSIENSYSSSKRITKIELYDIELKSECYTDIQFDGGLYLQEQKVVLLAYNNGNSVGNIMNSSIEISILTNDSSRFISVKVEDIADIKLESGEIQTIFIQEMAEFSSIFEEHQNYSALKLTLLDPEKSNDSPIELMMFYDRNQKKFLGPNLGGCAYPPELIPVLRVTEKNNKISATTSVDLASGASSLDFLILSDISCLLSYKIKLYSGKKKIKYVSENKLKIRVPVYYQEEGRFYGVFYLLVLKKIDIKSLTYNFKIDKKYVESIDKTLLYDRYEAVRQFYNVDI
ncbi:hypothetical protein [Streptococcus suis]|uniref:hypothetical protein n=3 Tax=Streptococcus suis TaxID=1307 RepID=UPI000CF5C191|nr:hypothetical protein [Streptococcus suis]